MTNNALPRCLGDLNDGDLLDRAFEPEFMGLRTPLEIELLWRLAAAVHTAELERLGQRQMLAALWPVDTCRKYSRHTSIAS